MTIKKIAVLTSGGDAPGMNACIRAICLTAQHAGIETVGYKHGYNGLLNQDFITLDPKRVYNLIKRGGTILYSARCEKFKQDQHAQSAAKNLDANDIDALIVIGGNGSFKGADHLQRFWSKPIIGVPGTIDNDIAGTDYTIGYRTAIQTAVDSIDKVRDTAEAFERIFLVEVMGNKAGFIALHSAIASGCDHVIVPERFTSAGEELVKIIDKLESRRKNKKYASHIITVTEKVWPGGLNVLADSLASETGIDVRVLTLGHVQRGGAPSGEDRVLATRLGTYAVQCCLEGKTSVMVAEQQEMPIALPIEKSWLEKKVLNSHTVDMLDKITLLG